MSNVFVIMPFGTKNLQFGQATREVDFDYVYKSIILPSCTDAGHEVARIDELDFTGNISRTIVEQLFLSELVIADLTGGNPNVFFELGIRQALTENPTILISQKTENLPFDISDQRVLFYSLDDVIEVSSAAAKLSSALSQTADKASSSPILVHLRDLGLLADPSKATDFEVDVRQKISRANSKEQLIGVWNWLKPKNLQSPYVYFELADKMGDFELWETAAEISGIAIQKRPEDYEFHRKRGWYLRNIGPDRYELAADAFEEALLLNPADPETLGMLAGLRKRQGKFRSASQLYEKGALLAPTLTYMRINWAAMILLNEISAGNEALEGIPAYRQVYRELIARGELQNAWTSALLGECSFVLGKDRAVEKYFSAALDRSDDPTVLRSSADQIELLGQHGFRKDEAMLLSTRLRDAVSGGDGLRKAKRENDGAQVHHDRLIIHLSDIHFGSKPTRDGARTSMHRFGKGDYSRPLVDHLCEELRRLDRSGAISENKANIVVSGDLAYSASEDEFKEALEALQSIQSEFSLPSTSFTFCPGNHDVDWANSRIDRNKRFDNYISFLKRFYGDEVFRSMYPNMKWDFSFDGARPIPQEIISANYDDQNNILFCSFNSCVYETEQHHYGYISLVQQRSMIELIDNIGVPDEATRVAVVHHHIHPYPEFINLEQSEEHWIDLSTIRDGGLFERFLVKTRFDLVLHGHKHQPQLRQTMVRDKTSDGEDGAVKPLIVCGAGSCGVASSELPHGIGNHYQVLELISDTRKKGADFIRLEWREISLDPAAEWATTKSWVVEG